MDVSIDEILKAFKEWPSWPSLLLFLFLEAIFLKFILPSEGYFFALGICIFWVTTLIA